MEGARGAGKEQTVVVVRAACSGYLVFGYSCPVLFQIRFSQGCCLDLDTSFNPHSSSSTISKTSTVCSRSVITACRTTLQLIKAAVREYLMWTLCLSDNLGVNEGMPKSELM